MSKSYKMHENDWREIDKLLDLCHDEMSVLFKVELFIC